MICGQFHDKRSCFSQQTNAFFKLIPEKIIAVICQENKAEGATKVGEEKRPLPLKAIIGNFAEQGMNVIDHDRQPTMLCSFFNRASSRHDAWYATSCGNQHRNKGFSLKA